MGTNDLKDGHTLDRDDHRFVRICGTCRGLYETEPSNETALVQRCHEREPKEEPWPGFDYNEWIRLCDCCAMAVVRSGSRWSSFFCADCRKRIIALNRSSQRAVIPIGRHSMMNSFGPQPQPDDEDAQAKSLLEFFKTFDETHAVLQSWKGERLERLIEAAGLSPDEDITLSEYLDRVSSLSGYGKPEAHQQLVRRMAATA